MLDTVYPTFHVRVKSHHDMNNNGSYRRVRTMFKFHFTVHEKNVNETKTKGREWKDEGG